MSKKKNVINQFSVTVLTKTDIKNVRIYRAVALDNIMLYCTGVAVTARLSPSQKHSLVNVPKQQPTICQSIHYSLFI